MDIEMPEMDNHPASALIDISAAQPAQE